MVAVSPAEQLRLVQAVTDSGGENLDNAAPGDVWYVISLAWYGRWKDYVGFKDGGNSGSGKRPGSIDNSDVADASLRLLNRSDLGNTFEIVPAAIWELLVSWHGVVEGSPVLPRTVVTDGGQNTVELSAPVFDLFVCTPGP